MKKIIISLLTLSTISIAIGNNTSALTYSDNVGLNFTFSPSLTVSLSSSDIVINDLTPGSSSDSNIITINVLSNNQNGYELKSSVGNSTHTNPSYDTRNLVYSNTTDGNSNSSNNAIFTSLDYTTTPTITSPSDFNDNEWGYAYSLDNSTWSNYNGLPLYSDTTNVSTLRTNTGPSSSSGDNTYFKIAAKAATTQTSGEYNNVINFTVVGNTNPVSFYDAFTEAASKPGSTITTLNGYYKMQDMTPAICNAVQVYDDDSHIQLIDIRDHEVYYIGKLKDDRCWLLDNLRLGSNDYEIPLTPEDTNIATNWTLPRGITSGFGSYTEPNINATYKNDTNVTSYGASSGKVGTYYSYCATSAGTYCYPRESGVGNIEHDICSVGWRIPTGGPNGEYAKSFSAYNNVSSYQIALSVVLSGAIGSGGINYFNVHGFLQSSTYSNQNYMYGIRLDSDAIYSQNHGLNRGDGQSIRCIANNQ